MQFFTVFLKSTPPVRYIFFTKLSFLQLIKLDLFIKLNYPDLPHAVVSSLEVLALTSLIFGFVSHK